MRIAYETMLAEFERVLTKYGFSPKRAHEAAEIFAQNSLAGVFSHGLNRFPRVVSYLEKGEIAKARAIQYEADRIIYKMCSAHGNLYAVQKEILRRMYGLELGSVRAPMPGLIPEDEPIVAEAQAMIEAAIAKL